MMDNKTFTDFVSDTLSTARANFSKSRDTSRGVDESNYILKALYFQQQTQIQTLLEIRKELRIQRLGIDWLREEFE